MKVPQFQPSLGEREYAAIKDCFDQNWITEGPKAKEFMGKLLTLTGAKYGVFAPNGTLALYLGLKAIDIGPGDEVIVPDFTFYATASSVAMTGATPIFADVNKENFQIDVSKCKELITPRTKAIMPVDIYGMSANMDEVVSFAKEHGLKIVEDAAQALGVKYKGVHAGTRGEIGCFSFFADKTITTGEGGMIVTNDSKLYDKLLYLRNQGRIDRGSFIHPQIGYNFRMTDIQLAIGIVQLERLPEIVSKKKAIYDRYIGHLRNIDALRFIKVEEGTDPYIPFRVAIIDRSGRAQKLMEHMKKNEIETRTFFYPMHLQPAFKHMNWDDSKFEGSNYGYNNGICLPSFVDLKEEQVDYVCDVIKKFYS